MGVQARMVKPSWTYYDYMLKFGGVMTNTDHYQKYLPAGFLPVHSACVFYRSISQACAFKDLNAYPQL